MLSSENISKMLYSFRLLKSSKHASLKFSFALDKLKKKRFKVLANCRHKALTFNKYYLFVNRIINMK